MTTPIPTSTPPPLSNEDRVRATSLVHLMAWAKDARETRIELTVISLLRKMGGKIKYIDPSLSDNTRRVVFPSGEYITVERGPL